MDNEKILKKIEDVNNKKEDFFLFKLERNGKIIHETKFIVPEYGTEIIDKGLVSMFYFFKDMTNALEENINEAHKKYIWEQMKNVNDGPK